MEGAQVPSGVEGFQGASLAAASSHQGGTVSNHLVEVASLQDGAPNRVVVALYDPSHAGNDLSGPILLEAGVPILQVVDFLSPTVHVQDASTLRAADPSLRAAAHPTFQAVAAVQTLRAAGVPNLRAAEDPSL